MLNSLTIQMRGNQFPFGILDVNQHNYKKMLIKKRYHYKNTTEYVKLRDKIDVLKNISHKNSINLRSTEDFNNGFIDLIYPYVPISLEQSFNQNRSQTVKEMHKQFIELTIHLAKNYILTSFNPSRCGVIVNQDKSLIKYYIPLNQIILTNNVPMLQRSVQLFSVQSMHYLDTISQSALNSTCQNSEKHSYYKNRYTIFPETSRHRRVSQPAQLLFNKNRKFSTNPIKDPQLRKLSNISRELTQFSELRRRRGAKQSTRVSVGSFNTLKNLITEDSQRDFKLRNYVSEAKIIKHRVAQIRQRSLETIKKFVKLQDLMDKYKHLSLLIRQTKKQI